MDQLSQLLNRGAQPLPIADSRLYAGAAARPPAYQKHTGSRLLFRHFGPKTASIVRNGQSRTMKRLKTNSLREWLHADRMITAPANTNTLRRRAVSTRPTVGVDANGGGPGAKK